MGRPLRAAVGGVIYHILNRANGRLPLFEKPGDYEAFEKVLAQAHERFPMRTLAYCMMPNHWHLVLWPRRDEELSRFMAWVTLTHTQRWHAHRRSAGAGHLYQGRFKSFPVQADEHFLTVCRYVERNPLRAKLVARAEEWSWSSLWRRGQKDPSKLTGFLSEWPVSRPRRWVEWINEPQTDTELAALRRSVCRGQPFGSEAWVRRTAMRLGLEGTLRSRGRPKVGVSKVPDTF
ncbi:MAG: transposase [Nitrospiraceae bacterium]